MSVNELQSVSRQFRGLILAAAILIFILIVLGGIVRVSGSGGSCPDWPTCFGQFTPPENLSAAIDYLHRLATVLVMPFLILSGWFAYRYFRKEVWISRPLFLALGVMLAQVVIGAAIVLHWLPEGQGWISTLHLMLSLLAQAAVVVAATAAFYRSQPGPALQLRFKSPFARLSLLVVGIIFLLLVSGAVVAESGASLECQGWPLCTPSSPLGWLSLVHRGIVALAAFVTFVLFIRAWRTQRSQAPILVSTTAAMVLFVAQALLGAKLVAGFPLYLLALHEVTAVAVWAALSVLFVTVGAAARTAEEEQIEAASWGDRPGLAKDFLMLTKPIVVALLLVTTYAGMVIGAQEWPSFSITFWTLVGGFMAAGGSGAINQYIDRFDDKQMQRTQKRPIPSGRMTASEGLAFGVAMTLGSFYLMVAFTNLLAALLSLAGIIYYVLLYSIFLKKTTVQNIVIGGGAGAIPPLVGWAAATGSLNIPALFLFAVVFMWTPPHFWALAIVRRKDYARAGVPMLPVVRGEEETRKQIFIYTLELVGLTLVLPIFGLGGGIYLLGAVLLGGWLIGAAYRVWKHGGNKVAWKMYRYSSMYLAFIFVVLMIDRLM